MIKSDCMVRGESSEGSIDSAEERITEGDGVKGELRFNRGAG